MRFRDLIPTILNALIIIGFADLMGIANDSTISGSLQKIIVYKIFCCASPYFESESREGFFVNDTQSQSIPQRALYDIRRLQSVVKALPVLQFRILENESYITIEGIDTKGIADHEALLDSTFAAEMSLEPGAQIQLKGRSFIIRDIIPPCTTFPELDVYLTHHAAKAVVLNGYPVSRDDLLNLISVELSDTAATAESMAAIKNIVGASARIVAGYDGQSDCKTTNTADTSCACKENSCS